VNYLKYAIVLLTLVWCNPAEAKTHELIQTHEKIEYSAAELKCLTENIYYEAKSLDKTGKVAVAQVTLNRMKDPHFSKSICGVINQKNQFSWAKKRNKLCSGKEWEDSKEVAKEVINGLRLANFDKALFYHATYCHPKWNNLTLFAVIGQHKFYTKT